MTTINEQIARLSENESRVDLFTNGAADHDVLTRFGQTYPTLQKLISNIYDQTGYLVPVAYTSGISLTSPNQTVEYAGETYAPLLSQLPFTTSGTFETAKFRLIQGVTRLDLAAPSGASLVGYMPAGVGGVSTTQDAVNNRIVSIKNFGATGDGSTNDSQAILAAAVYVSGLGGGTVDFPAPSVAYAMNPTNFTGLTNVKFMGNGAKVISRLPANAPYAPFSFVNCTNCQIDSLEIDGRYPHWVSLGVLTESFNNGNIVLTNCNGFAIRNCYLHDSGVNRTGIDKFGDGVYVTSLSKNVTISNNRFYNSGRWDVAVVSSAGGITIQNNTSEFSGTGTRLGFVDLEMGSSVPEVSNVNISGNNVIGATIINLSGTNGFKNVTIANNTLSGYALDGTQHIGLYSYGVAVENTKNCTINGNIVNGHASAQALSIVNCSYSTVFGNLFTSIIGPTYPPNGAYITGSSNLQICNNQFYVNKTSGFGFQCSTSSSVTLIGNVISNPLEWGMSMTGDTLIIKDNVFIGAANEATSIGGTSTNAVVMGNYSPGLGRIGVGAHFIANNAMTFSTTAGNWFDGGGTYINPDKSMSRSYLYKAAVPATGTWKVGDIVKNSAPVVGQPKGWVCTTAGTMGTLNSGATTGNITAGTALLTVNSATGLYVGQYITIAGVTGTKTIISIVGLVVTISTNASATVTAAAIAFFNGVFVSEGNL